MLRSVLIGLLIVVAALLIARPHMRSVWYETVTTVTGVANVTGINLMRPQTTIQSGPYLSQAECAQQQKDDQEEEQRTRSGPVSESNPLKSFTCAQRMELQWGWR